jgi:hypothetical protein
LEFGRSRKKEELNQRTPDFSPTISHDPNLKTLLETENLDICISTSSLKVLFASQADDARPFEIPVIVKTDGRGQKTVMIDKPLASVRSSTKARFKTFLKHKARQALLTIAKTTTWYNVWKLGTLKVLVRCKVAATGPRGDNLVVKPEYQLERGKEVVTDAEKLEWYISTFIKPSTDLKVITIDPVSEEIIEKNRIRCGSILDDTGMATLHLEFVRNLFQQLKELEGGSYYVCRSTDSRDIHVFKRSSKSEPTNFPIGPLVPMTKPAFDYHGLQWSGHGKQIPWTFPPAAEARMGKFIVPFPFCDLFRQNRCRKKCGSAHISHNSLHALCFHPRSWFHVPGLQPFEPGNRKKYSKLC